jgi:cytochrome b561
MAIQLSDSSYKFGLVSASLHWLIATTFIGLFGVGWYMVTLGYYDSWYTILPHWHKSIGMLLFLAVVFRGLWRFFVRKPANLESHRAWEVSVSGVVHWLLGIGVVIALVSGYLIPTAEGSGIEIFDWFTVPALLGFSEQEDISGIAHRYVAYFVLALSALHASAALKHHFIDRDVTLRRILPVSANRSRS